MASSSRRVSPIPPMDAFYTLFVLGPVLGEALAPLGAALKG